MNRFLLFFLMFMLCVPTFAQRATDADYNLSADYKKYTNLKKAGVAGIVVFGTTWLAGNVICVVEQNRYANDLWDGESAEEFARLSREARQQHSYKVGEAMEIVGFVGTGVSVFLTAKYGKKARKIRDSLGNEVASLGMDFGPTGMSLKLTF